MEAEGATNSKAAVNVETPKTETPAATPPSPERWPTLVPAAPVAKAASDARARRSPCRGGRGPARPGGGEAGVVARAAVAVWQGRCRRLGQRPEPAAAARGCPRHATSGEERCQEAPDEAEKDDEK